jgi:hypothetical protein
MGAINPSFAIRFVSTNAGAEPITGRILSCCQRHCRQSAMALCQALSQLYSQFLSNYMTHSESSQNGECVVACDMM